MYRSLVNVFPKILRLNYSKSLIRKSFVGCYSTATPKTSEKLNAPALEGVEKEFPEHVIKIVDQIATLTLLEVANLNELLTKRLNIKAPVHSTSFVPVQQGPPIKQEEPEDTEQASTKMSYSVKLMKFDAAKKVSLIKEIKNILPDMNLVQAKKLVEAAPSILKKDLCKEEADTIRKALEACGASVELE